jgi:hypothetical protein
MEEPFDLQLLSTAWNVTATLTVLSAAGIGIWMIRMSGAIRRSGRFPPEGARLLAVTPVVHGEAALRRARILSAIGMLTMVVAGAMAAVAWRLHSMIDPMLK